jgi:hypothetical protein
MSNPKPPLTMTMTRTTFGAWLFVTWMASIVGTGLLSKGTSLLTGITWAKMLVVTDRSEKSGSLILTADPDLGPNISFSDSPGKPLLNLGVTNQGGFSLVTFYKNGKPVLELGIPVARAGKPGIRFTDPETGEKIVYPPEDWPAPKPADPK